MSITFAQTLPELSAAIMDYAVTHAAALPAEMQASFTEFLAVSSQTTRMVEIAELFYSRMADIDAPARDLAAKCAQFAARWGFHEMSVRGMQISDAMQRENGYAAPAGGSWPDAADDPAVLGKYAPIEAEAAA